MENYKLKHLRQFCCHPATELEFEAVKMAAEIGGVEYFITTEDCIYYSKMTNKLSNCRVGSTKYVERKEIPILDFCNKLRMSEEEARKLEDDAVYIAKHSTLGLVVGSDSLVKKIGAYEGYKWKLNEDGTEVTLHKRD